MCPIRIHPKPQLLQAVEYTLAYLLAVTRERFTARGWEGRSPLMTTTHWGTQPGSQDAESSVQAPPACTAAPSFTSSSYNPGKSCYKVQSLQTLFIVWLCGCLHIMWESISLSSGLEYSVTFCDYFYFHGWEAGMVLLGGWLDLMILGVFSNL